MSLVKGENVILAFFENGQWYQYACARSASININIETIDTSVSGNGRWVTNQPTRNSFSGTFEGIVSLHNVDILSLPDIESRAMAQTEMLFRYQSTAADGTIYTKQGYCFFTGTSQVASFDNVSTFNINFIGNGQLTQVFTPILQPTPIMYRYEYTATGGETGFTDASLIGKDIQSVSKDGVDNAKIVTGTPGSKEVQYVTATGQFVWAIPFDVGEIAVINYQNL